MVVSGVSLFAFAYDTCQAVGKPLALSGAAFREEVQCLSASARAHALRSCRS
jgi:hypothetical protein